MINATKASWATILYGRTLQTAAVRPQPIVDLGLGKVLHRKDGNIFSGNAVIKLYSSTKMAYCRELSEHFYAFSDYSTARGSCKLVLVGVTKVENRPKSGYFMVTLVLLQALSLLTLSIFPLSIRG